MSASVTGETANVFGLFMNFAAHTQEGIMKAISIAAALIALTAAPSMAQTERGYLSGAGGFEVSPDTTSGNMLGEVGVRVAPHLMVFGDLGRFRNVQPSDVQPQIDNATATLSGSGLNVIGAGRVPATYSVGGLRFDAPTKSIVSPYVLGGIGFARLSPMATFTYSSGTLPDGSTPIVGDDVTSQLETAGAFTAPNATNAFMFTLGGGVQIPVARHWAIDAGYRYSRINADTPLNAQGATFGFGYRF
jgi:opacity protein-like surface antigen